jgi:hypothetical protein
MKKIQVTERHLKAALKTLGYTAVAVPAAALSPAPLLFAAVAAAVIGYKAIEAQRMATWESKPERERLRLSFLETVKHCLQDRGLPVTEENMRLMAALLKAAWSESDHSNKEKICAVFEDVVQNPR